MKYLGRFIVLVLVSSGCDRRQNLAAVPDRSRHAPGWQECDIGEIAPSPREMWYTLQPGEGLYHVAQRFGVDLGTLIRRNDLQNDARDVRPGRQLIVPRTARADAEGRPL